MYLNKKQIAILSILNVKPCYFKELTKLYLSLGSETYDSYYLLRESTKFLLLTLMKNKLIQREGKRRHYKYSITTKGIQQLISHNLKRLIIVM